MEHPATPPFRTRDGLATAVVANPAKIADVVGYRRIVEQAFAEAGWPAPAWYETTPQDHGYGQARRAIADGAQVVLVCGGDGTVAGVIRAVVGTEVALGVLPVGTGNLLAANLGLPDDPAAGVAVVVDMGRRRIDVGEVDGRYFAVMAGMGIDAAMVAQASERLKARIGVAAYVLSAARRLRDRSMRVAVRVDDDPPLRRRARSVLVGNVGRLQGGVRLLAAADPGDGLLDVAIITPRSLLDWSRLALAVLRRAERVPRMQVVRARRVTILSSREQARQLDGEVISSGTRLDATVVPAALELCVPRPARTPDIAEGAPG